MLRQWTKSKPSEPVNLLSNKTIIPNKTFQQKTKKRLNQGVGDFAPPFTNIKLPNH